MSSLSIFMWVNTCIAICGTYLNTIQKRFGFILWMITNVVFVGFNLYIKVYSQAALFGVYFGLALFGWINWGRQAEKKKETEEVA